MGSGTRDYPNDWNSRRRDVYRRDNYTCQNCGAKGGSRGEAELHAHHVVPKRKGGSNDISNLTTVCVDCHKAIHEKNKKAPTASKKKSSDSKVFAIPHPSAPHTRSDCRPPDKTFVSSKEVTFAIIIGVVGYILEFSFWFGLIILSAWTVVIGSENLAIPILISLAFGTVAWLDAVRQDPKSFSDAYDEYVNENPLNDVRPWVGSEDDDTGRQID